MQTTPQNPTSAPQRARSSPPETPDNTGRVPSSVWLERVADWVEASSRRESGELAHELRAIARRLAPETMHPGLPPSPAWLAALADWISQDHRPQALQIARQFREWNGGRVIWLD